MFESITLMAGQPRRENPTGGAAVVRALGHDVQIEERVMCSATPLAANFSAAVDGKGMNQIWVGGVGLLQGAGFHMIGSRGTTDDPNNVASDSPQNSPGVMRPYQGTTGGAVPYGLTFNRNTGDASKIGFNLHVGRSSTGYDVMNFPLEANLALFNYWRQSGAPDKYERFDQNGNGKPSYADPKDGNYYVALATGSPTWGEIIGLNYTIRVTITGATVSAAANVPAKPLAVSLGFVNAPGLGGGIRDVEFGFGGLPAQALKTASGFIQVFKTDPSLLPKLTYQAESSSLYQIGQAQGDGRSATATQIGYLQYGPYLSVDNVEAVRTTSSNLPAGDHGATFRLLVDNTTADNNRLLTIDVYDAVTGKDLPNARMDISRKSFSKANTYQDFKLNFTAKPGQKLEFRVYSWGGSFVKLDNVTVV